MKIINRLPLALILAGFLCAHPMGSSSVSHYSRLTVTPRGVDLLYALDLAELPTMDLMRQWGEKADIQKHAEDQAREWATHLAITSDGAAAPSPMVARGRAKIPLLVES